MGLSLAKSEICPPPAWAGRGRKVREGIGNTSDPKACPEGLWLLPGQVVPWDTPGCHTHTHLGGLLEGENLTDSSPQGPGMRKDGQKMLQSSLRRGGTALLQAVPSSHHQTCCHQSLGEAGATARGDPRACWPHPVASDSTTHFPGRLFPARTSQGL